MTAPREILPGRDYSISRRVTQRQHLLRPDLITTAIIAFCLGVAARRCAIQLIAWSVLSNHYHAVVHDPEGRLPEFLEHFHKMTARALNARWGRRENLWSSEPTCVVYLPTPESVFEQVIYVLANPIRAFLVERLADWPGLSSLHHLGGKVTRHERPSVFFRANGPAPESTELTAVQPQFSKLVESHEAWAARVRAELTRVEEETRRQRRAKGQRVLGRAAILAVSHLDSPSTPRGPVKIRPTVASRDPAIRNEELRKLREFWQRYHDARIAFRDGNRGVEFPPGTFRLRKYGVVCAPYPPAMLAAA
jgi:putative transposase